MWRALSMALVLALVVPLWLGPGPARAADCQFVLGFKALHDMIPAIVGDCRTNEYHNPANGDGLQETTGVGGKGGLLVWRKADNWTAYTDGYRTWVNGPYGLQQRLNTERFTWEIEATVPAPASPRVLGTYDLRYRDGGIELRTGGPSTLTYGPAVSLHFDLSDRGKALRVVTDGMYNSGGQPLPVRPADLYHSLIGPVYAGLAIQVDNGSRAYEYQAVPTSARSVAPGVVEWTVEMGDYFVYYGASSLESEGTRPDRVRFHVEVLEPGAQWPSPSPAPTATPGPSTDFDYYLDLSVKNRTVYRGGTQIICAHPSYPNAPPLIGAEVDFLWAGEHYYAYTAGPDGTACVVVPMPWDKWNCSFTATATYNGRRFGPPGWQQDTGCTVR